MKFLDQLLHRLRPSKTDAPAPLHTEPLPDNWLTDIHFDLSRLSLEQLLQKAAHHEAEAERLELIADQEEEDSLQREATIQAHLKDLQTQDLDLQLEGQRLRGALQHEQWVGRLCRMFGEEIGTKLANHEIEPGMTQRHLLYTYGVPEPQNIAIQGNAVIYCYGNVAKGAYFELVDGIITQVAILIPPPYPPHAFDDYDEEAA